MIFISSSTLSVSANWNANTRADRLPSRTSFVCTTSLLLNSGARPNAMSVAATVATTPDVPAVKSHVSQPPEVTTCFFGSSVPIAASEHSMATCAFVPGLNR